MLEEISIQIRYQASTVFELVDMLCVNPQLKELKFLSIIRDNIAPGRNFTMVWQEGLHAGINTAFRPEDIEFLDQVGLSLGSTDIAGQLNTLELHKNNLAMIRQKAEEECKRKTKLYRSLGVLSGVFLSIMLL